jgi:hypothetical protein
MARESSTENGAGASPIRFTRNPRRRRARAAHACEGLHDSLERTQKDADPSVEPGTKVSPRALQPTHLHRSKPMPSRLFLALLAGALCGCSTSAIPVAPGAAPAPQMPGVPELRVGAATTGHLGADSGQVTYRFAADAGDRLRLTLSSDSFDTVVEVGRVQEGEWVPVDSNDDADGTNSRLSLVIGSAGEYRVRARAYEEGSSGPFRLELSSESDPTCCAAAIGPAVDYPGLLDDDDRSTEAGAPYEPYLLHGRAGEAWMVTMRSSAFAPQVRIGRWTSGAFQELVAGTATPGPPAASTAVLRFPADGDYLVMASARDRSARGPYRIVVERSDTAP